MKKILTMVERTAFTVLALLALSVEFSHAVDEITLSSMTWGSSEGMGTVKVCATDKLYEDDSGMATITYHLVISLDGSPQESLSGQLDTDIKCANFAEMDLPDAPITTSTMYELTVYADDVAQQSGAVTYAFPLSKSSTFTCGSSNFGRFATGGTDLSGVCIESNLADTCYVLNINLTIICAPGLDSNHADFEVCVPSETQVSNTADITGVSLTYDVSGVGGIFTIEPSDDTNTLELLSRVKGSTDAEYVASCTDSSCTFETGKPGESIYELCAVYVNNTNGDVASIGVFQFQDVNLVVDSVETTVDFHFTNKAPDGFYEIYGGDGPSDPFSGTPSFTLDCTHIEQDDICNGFFTDVTPPADVGVSYTSAAGTNAVITSIQSVLGRSLVPSVTRNATASHHHNSRGAQETPGSA